MLIQAHSSEIGKVWPTLNDGDSLQLLGRFDGWRPTAKAFSPTKRLAVDCSQAILSNCYAGSTARLVGIDWHDMHIEGGPLTSRGLRIDAGSDMSFQTVHSDGKGVVGVGLWLAGLMNVEVLGLTSVGFLRAITFGNCQGVKLAGHDLSGFGTDGFDLTNCQDVLVDDGFIHDSANVTGSHPDAGQIVSQPGLPRCARITIQNQRVHGTMQGFNLFNNVGSGQLGGEDITIRDGEIAITYTWAVCLQDVDRGLIENMKISTLPGAPAQAIIGVEYHDPSAVNSVQRYGNTIAAYGSKPAIIDPARPAPPAPVPVVRSPADVLADLVANGAAGSKLLAELQAAIAAAA